LINNLNEIVLVSPLNGEIIKTIKLRFNIFDKLVFANRKIYFSATKGLKTKLVEVY